MENLSEQIENLMESGKYKQAAKLFIERTGLTIHTVYLHTVKNKWREEDKPPHVYNAVFNVTFTRADRQPFTFEFTNSMADSFKSVSIHNMSYDDKKALEHFARSPKNLRYGSYARVNKRLDNYSILSCMLLIDGDFDDFCADFGYDTDSKSAERIYQECLRQSHALRAIFDHDEIEALQMII